MSDKYPQESEPESDPNFDTMIVPPPNFRERVQAAQRARASEVRKTIGLPNPLAKSSDEEALSTPDDDSVQELTSIAGQKTTSKPRPSTSSSSKLTESSKLSTRVSSSKSG